MELQSEGLKDWCIYGGRGGCRPENFEVKNGFIFVIIKMLSEIYMNIYIYILQQWDRQKTGLVDIGKSRHYLLSSTY